MSRRDPGSTQFADRLLAESVRVLERDGAAPVDDPQAEAKAIEIDGDLEHRIAVRAAALPVAGRLRAALRQTGRAIAVILAAGMLLVVIAGAGAARASLAAPGGGPVNVFWALGGLLGVQTLLLAAWTLIMLKGPSALAGASLGGAVLGLGRRLASRWRPGAEAAAAIEAAGAVFARGGIGRWTLSAVSHGLWLVFNAACLLLIVLMLSARHYRFVWETTILSADTYVALTRGISFLPERLGFPVPTRVQVEASEGPLGPGDSESMRHAWSGLLVGSLVTYGLGPRLVLFSVCLVAARRARRRFRLDLDRPGYLRLAPRLMPRTEWLGVIDADTGEPTQDEPAAARERRSPTGPPAILGLEIAAPATSWPPQVDGIKFRDLGFVDSRQDRHRILGELEVAEGDAGSAVIVAVCDLTTTPDRGVGAFLRQVRDASGARLALVLTGGEALRHRGEHVATRVEDWRKLADGAGVGDVLELDLDHLTDASAAGLAQLVGAGAASRETGGRRIEDAFDLIVNHLDKWPAAPEAPDARAQAKLHEAIGALYRRELSSWIARLGRLDFKADVAAPLRAGAQKVVGVLPARLGLDPKWLAAGAVAGALGCVSAAVLLAPAAIASLPAWSALGAAVGAVVRRTLGDRAAAEPEHDPDDGRAEAVRSAALFALLLELQGRDEAAITRILDEVAGGDPGENLGDAAAARGWLDGLRHRLDLALASEAAS